MQVCVLSSATTRNVPYPPLPSQRLSAPLIYIQSFLPPLSHVTVISPLSQVDDVCHHFDLSLTTRPLPLPHPKLFQVFHNAIILCQCYCNVSGASKRLSRRRRRHNRCDVSLISRDVSTRVYTSMIYHWY